MKTTVETYARFALPHFKQLLKKNSKVLLWLSNRLVKDVEAKKSLFVFGSGHSALFSMELYHRAGGASFVIPIVLDRLLPTAGPPKVRVLERMPGVTSGLLDQYGVKAGEMLWLASQSGINGAIVDLALEAKQRKIFTVAFTSLPHSQSAPSRHPSQKKLFEICDAVVDLGGVPGDAVVPIGKNLLAGPLSTLSAVFLGHSILVHACARLEKKRIRVIYTSVNTEGGEERNRELERLAAERDPRLRE